MNGVILFEDEHLLVANKPAGINTHKPHRFAPDGLHEWLCKRRGSLSILQRLDKDTSGVIVFGKSRQANQSLARQFETHAVQKEYLLLASTRPSRATFRARTADAETQFELVQAHGRHFLVRARPLTGKTHQIRRHAAANGFPIPGDRQYGGAPASRLMLHAHRLSFRHPATSEPVAFQASVPRAFDDPGALTAAREFRDLLFSPPSPPLQNCVTYVTQFCNGETDAFRLISGEADGFGDVIVDWYAGRLLVQWRTEAARSAELLEELRQRCEAVGAYEQLATRQKRSPVTATPRFVIQENGIRYLVGFGEGLSPGIFLDQRENRRRLLTMRLAGKFVLNLFAYTCAFSVAAAKAGAVTASVDLSRRYLAWGQDNFRANGLDVAGHEFVAGDVFEWLKRFGKRDRRWDVVLVDPPTFSTTKRGRVFQAARDYAALAALAMPAVAPGGWLFCSTNQRTLAPQQFEDALRAAAKQSGRVIEELEFETQPFDFRVAEGERPYLKTFWARLA